MTGLDARLLRRSLDEEPIVNLEKLDVFESVASTNSYLLAERAPAVGRIRVAVADRQTAGRGRHANRWLSPPGAGVYLSLAYTFAEQPAELPALTLALGVGIVDVMRGLNVDDIKLKWPNDIVALDGKLGGVLTEAQSKSGGGITVVAGVGLNIDLPETLQVGADSAWAQRAVDLKSLVIDYPERERIAAALVRSLCTSMATFEEQGFAAFADAWRRHDWLLGRSVVVEMPERRLAGIAAGVDADGALLVETPTGRTRVINGSIVLPDATEARQ